MTEYGLYCPQGDFYIDPKSAVNRAVITHAHSDHARKGSQQYYCTASGAALLKVRLGKNISLLTFEYGEKFRINDVEISFHPAGHILGSAQIRVAAHGDVWVVSGDYKRDADPTCTPFESVPCNVFISEATFGTPAFRWQKDRNFGLEINEWWQQNQALGFNSILFAYSLGKAQRVLNALYSLAQKPIYCHPAAEQLNECYRKEGILLPNTICLSTLNENSSLNGELIIAPTSFLKTPAKFKLGKYKTAFASGWMKRESNYYDKGFIMSDHADWNDLLLSIEQSLAKTVYVQHRGSGALVKELKSRGIRAYPEAALFPKCPQQLMLF